MMKNGEAYVRLYNEKQVYIQNWVLKSLVWIILIWGLKSIHINQKNKNNNNLST